jgi:hypothetical protein
VVEEIKGDDEPDVSRLEIGAKAIKHRHFLPRFQLSIILHLAHLQINQPNKGDTLRMTVSYC